MSILNSGLSFHCSMSDTISKKPTGLTLYSNCVCHMDHGWIVPKSVIINDSGQFVFYRRKNTSWFWWTGPEFGEHIHFVTPVQLDAEFSRCKSRQK